MLQTLLGRRKASKLLLELGDALFREAQVAHPALDLVSQLCHEGGLFARRSSRMGHAPLLFLQIPDPFREVLVQGGGTPQIGHRAL